VLHAIKIKPRPVGIAPNVAGNLKDSAIRRQREMAVLRQRVELDRRVRAGGSDDGPGGNARREPGRIKRALLTGLSE
jgi:hypothetical protein